MISKAAFAHLQTDVTDLKKDMADLTRIVGLAPRIGKENLAERQARRKAEEKPLPLAFKDGDRVRNKQGQEGYIWGTAHWSDSSRSYGTNCLLYWGHDQYSYEETDNLELVEHACFVVKNLLDKCDRQEKELFVLRQMTNPNLADVKMDEYNTGPYSKQFTVGRIKDPEPIKRDELEELTLTVQRQKILLTFARAFIPDESYGKFVQVEKTLGEIVGE